MLKEKLVTVYASTYLKWPEALSLVLWDVQNALWGPVGLLVKSLGRHLAMPGTCIPDKTNLLGKDDHLIQYVLYMKKGFEEQRKYAQ